MSDALVLRPRFGRILAVVVGALCAVAAVMIVVQSPADAWRVLPLPALFAFVTWAAYWQPSVRVADDGVTVGNVFHTEHVPWGQIARIDTRYALTLYTSNGRVTAWAAPAPGRHSILFADRKQGEHLPESSYVAGSVRPGDLVNSESGAAAYVVRRQWEKLRDADRLVDDGSPRRIRVHTLTIAITVVLVTAVALGALL
ncbi:PH domain-containing protein [Microbacterium sp. NIBRBAC000506063]|uniref:PH domain-containing protein n=1 Tax=Microbacterium sp. NIBRBAC000506063 TaxID=2734618 RepID=UPI001CB71472|nr:PH domain-containing protein [Microbacterium sp. NIBRBAC000506063]